MKPWMAFLLAASILGAGYIIGPYMSTHKGRWNDCVSYSEHMLSTFFSEKPDYWKRNYQVDFMDKCLLSSK
jgi:hypothetical protein